MTGLGDVVVLAGSNGSGKSRIFKMLTQHIQSLAAEEHQISAVNGASPTLVLKALGENGEEKIENSNWENVEVFNYSQYNQPLQSPKNFTPHVLEKTVHQLEECDFESTAKNALLYLRYLSEINETAFLKENHPQGISPFQTFQNFLKEFSQLDLVRSVNENGTAIQTTLCGQLLDSCQLSPGQQYLLRMCVSLHCNQVSQKDFILLLDEPETHLHPDVLGTLISKVQAHFKNGQLWIATHSVALLSLFDSSDIWHVTPQKVRRLGSQSEELIHRLVGDEDKRRNFYRFISSPDWYACYEYGIECLKTPTSIETTSSNDPQISLAMKEIQKESHPFILDYGAGKGRFFHGLATDYPELLSSIHYLAYNLKTVEKCDALDTQNRPSHFDEPLPCKDCMSYASCDNAICLERLQSNSLPPKDHFFHDINQLKQEYTEKISQIFLINVLHEIPPKEWCQIFRTLGSLLKEDGQANIIELNEFTYGEKAYDQGTFLVLQEKALDCIQHLTKNPSKLCSKTHKDNPRVRNYTIPKEILLKMDQNTVKLMLEALKDNAIIQLQQLREKSCDSPREKKSKEGMRLVFWQQQFVEASFQLLQWESNDPT